MTNTTQQLQDVTPALMDVKHITDPLELEAGVEYWLVGKHDQQASPAFCNQRDNHLYFKDYLWAIPGNNQAMRDYDIFGPIPPRIQPDFASLRNAG